jgi:hypothetical protein
MNGPALMPTELLPLDELAQRLRLSPKSVRRLSKRGLPLIRLSPPRGPLYAFWPDVVRWIRKHGEVVSRDN